MEETWKLETITAARSVDTKMSLRSLILEMLDGFVRRESFVPLHVFSDRRWSEKRAKPEVAPGLLLQAARHGDVSTVRKVLRDFPNSILEVTPSRETALHLAVRHDHHDAFSALMEHLKGKFYHSDIIHMKDSGGDSVLHLAVARKQLKIVQMLLENSPADDFRVSVNAKNSGGFRALDILDVLPEGGAEDLEIEKALRRAGALRARECGDIAENKVETNLFEQKHDKNKHEVFIEFDDRLNEPLHYHRSESLITRYFAALVIATMLAAMAFHAALRPPAALTQEIEIYPHKEQNAVISHLFVLFNSVSFFSSVTFIAVMMHELPIKPWLHITLFSATGAYMCSIMAVAPHEVMTVICIGMSIFLAALSRGLSVHKRILHSLQLIRARVHLI